MPGPLRWLAGVLIVNPVAVRLVQNGSRRTRHAIVRTAYLGALIVVLLLLLLANIGGQQNFRTIAGAGAQAFQVVAYLQLGLICVLTPVFMAGAIAAESNPRTWDVMLTTPMGSFQIVLGQLLGRLFFVFALLFASLPLFALTQYFGGVPGRSVLLSYIVSAGAATLVGAVAIALAVNRLAGRRAVFTFYVSVISYLGVTFALDLAMQSGSGGVTALTPVNPFLALRALLQPASYPTPDAVELTGMHWARALWFGHPVVVWSALSLGLSALLVVVSSLNVRAMPSRVRISRRRTTGERFRDARRVGRNPIAWREAAARQSTLAKTVLRWSFIAAGGVFGVALVVVFHVGQLNIEGFQLAMVATAMTELAIIALIAINISATAISREREDGTLDLLLTTPITAKQYLSGKLRGVILYLLPMLCVPLATVAIASAYVALGGFGRSGGVIYTASVVNALQIDIPAMLPELALLLPLVSVAFLAFCVTMGLHASLRSKGTIGSVISTVAIITVVAGVLGACSFQLAREVAYIGPAAAATTPATLLYAMIRPADAMHGALEQLNSLTNARYALAIGSLVSTSLYLAITFALRSAMTNSFDRTTRQLAGTR
ncbi:MAG: ABC transporter permease subunit [Planctomycetota bacterium]